MIPTLSEQIKSEAHRLGFTLVGITTPDPPASFPAYQDWLRAGHQAEMGYLATERAIERRGDPRLILPECRSILVLGIHYPPAVQTPIDNSAHRGQVAAYAWNDDYHDVLKPRLQALAAFLTEQTGQEIPQRWYTDTGPLLERDLAQRAGLGWVGKNSMLIDPQAGSSFLLAEMLLGIELDPDPALTSDHCGSCTRCLQACPTDCILPNRTIDARRCLSYLTIENKGSIPIELRPMLGNWVFGCDICQQVCPWNQRFAPASNEPAFAPRPNLPQPDLHTEIGLTPQTFNQKFKGSPVKRAKRRGYLRNVAVVLGNQGNPASLPYLTDALTDLEPLIRQHAAWALGQIGGADALAALQQAKNEETDPQVRNEIILARQKIEGVS